jgi:hypothetical protein
VKKQSLYNEEKVVKRPAAFVESISVGQKGSNLVPEYWKSKLVKIMEQLQDVGVKSHQHIKRPYLFTGSWMEGVTTIEQLFDRVKGITANEAMLRLFNIIQPYEGDLPGETKDEVAASNFYGEYYNFEVPKETRVDLSAIGNSVIEQSKIAQMNSALELSNKKNEELNSKIAALLKDGQEYQVMIGELKTKNSDFESMKSQYAKIQESVRFKESSLFEVQKQKDDLQQKLAELVTGKELTISTLQKDLQDRELEIQKLKKDATLMAAKVKLLESNPDKSSAGGYGGSNSKVMNRFERKAYVAQQLSPEDALALGTLMNKLRGNPPDLATRLRNEDKDSNEMVNSYEYLQALDKIHLDPAIIQRLRTIAGFLKYDEIYITDFVELVNRKAVLDSQSEKNYMEHFLRAFERKRMTVQEALDQFDINHDSVLDLEEFRKFVTDLGVTLDDSSLAELFRLLDSDFSGGISLPEFKSKLAALEYEKISKDPKKIQELEEKLKDKTSPKKDIGKSLKNVVKRVEILDSLNAFKDENKAGLEVVDEAERLKRILEKAGKGIDYTKNNDLEPLVGEIKIQFQKLDKLQVNTSDFKTYFLLIRLPGITKNWIEKEIYTHALSTFKYAMRITIMNVLEENVGKSVMIKLVGLSKADLRVDLGSCEVPWKKALEIPNEWVINNSFALEAGDGKPNPAEAKIQLKWIAAGSDEFKASIYDDYYLKKSFSAPRKDEGYLMVDVASAILKDCSGNVTLKLSTPDQKSFSLEPEHTIGDERQFNKPFVCPLKFNKDDGLVSIYIEVKHGKELLGDVFVNWSECIYFTREFCENKAFLLYKDKARTKHKVYLRFQFLTKTQALQMNLDDKKDVAKDSSAFITGVMKVGIARAKNLIGEEKGDGDKLKSDPLVVFKFKNADKYIKYTTDEIENNLNPIWNEDMSFRVKILKGGAIPPFEIEVYDHDTWSANDLIGSTMIKPDLSFEKPCTWALNGYFPLTEGEKKLPAGELYLRSYFVPDGTFDPNENPRDAETGEIMQIKTNKAKLYFRVLAGKDLVFLEKGVPQLKASPYLEIKYPNGKSSSSKTASDTLNPFWYYNYMGSVDLPEPGSALAPVIVGVWHKTWALAKDDQMSMLKVDLQKCVDNKGKWALNELLPIPGEEKYLRPNNLKNMGTLYIQAKIVESTRIDDDVEPQCLIEMPKIGEGEIKGTLLFHLVHCKDLPKVDSGAGGNLCDAQIDFATKGGKTIESSTMWATLNPEWNTDYSMPYKVSGIADVQPLVVTIYDKDKMSARDLVGSIQTDLMPCLTNPGKWGINKVFNIDNIEEEHKAEGETPQIYFQVKFLPEGQVDDGIQAPILEDIERTVQDRKRKGKLIIRVVHARGLIRGDSGLAGSLSDPYAELSLPPNNKTYKTDTIKNTLIPHWKKEFVHPIEINDIRYVPPMNLKVYDHDNVFVGGQDDLIGNVDIDLKPVLNDSNVWAINKLFEMNGPSKLKDKLKLKNFGMVYVQLLFLKDGENQTTKEPPLVEDIQVLAKQSEVKGTILVNVVHGKDLMRNDKPWFGGGPGSSDPFVRLKWPNGTESQTKVRDGTITPVWNELLKSTVELNKLNIPLLFVEVIDHNTLSNDQLGFCNVDIDPCVMNPGKWMVNGNFTLEGGAKFVKDFKAFGEVYLQVMFLEGTATHDGTLPVVNENLKEVIDRAAVKGTIEIKLIHAENLKAGDNSGKSDPFVIFTMPDKKEIKSKVIPNSLNPVWNQEFKYPISVTTTTVEPIFMKVIDEDTAFNDDLGKCSFQIFECLKNPGKWLVDDIIQIEPMTPNEDKKAKTEQLGEIYLQARFVKEGMTDNTPPPSLKKDLGKLIQDKRIDGKLVVRLVHAKGLQVKNPSDCKIFAEVKLGDGKDQNTKSIPDRNPLFNHVFEFPLALESPEFLKPVCN